MSRDVVINDECSEDVPQPGTFHICKSQQRLPLQLQLHRTTQGGVGTWLHLRRLLVNQSRSLLTVPKKNHLAERRRDASQQAGDDSGCCRLTGGEQVYILPKHFGTIDWRM
jgi:hypothetical protein